MTEVTPLFKVPRLRSEKHLKRVRQLPCMITGTSPSDPHHLMRADGLRGQRKSADCWVVPLSREMHQALHSYGDEIDWFELAGFDYEEQVKGYARVLWAESEGMGLCKQRGKA